MTANYISHVLLLMLQHEFKWILSPILWQKNIHKSKLIIFRIITLI